MLSIIIKFKKKKKLNSITKNEGFTTQAIQCGKKGEIFIEIHRSNDKNNDDDDDDEHKKTTRKSKRETVAIFFFFKNK